MLLVSLIIAGIVIADQASKWAIVRFLKEAGSAEVIPGVFRFTYVENTGAAFGMLSNARWVFMVLSCVMIAAVLYFLWKKKPQSKLLRLSLAFVVGGGVGNMIDRTFLGYVVDFLDFCAFPKIWHWVFNVADSFVVIGAGMLALYLILDTVKEIREGKKPVQAEENHGEN